MCAMRVYELQAIGTLLISNYSAAVYNQFPNIPIIVDNTEISSVLNSHDDYQVFKIK